MKIQKLSWLGITAIILFFNSCKDDCGDVTCFNGGVCDDGKCGCPLDYTGEFCETRIEEEDDPTPRTRFPVRFLEIELTDFPSTKPIGIAWDEFGCGGMGPDIYLTIENDTGIVYTSEVLENCNPNIDYKFSTGIPFISPNAFATFVFRIYDRDNEVNCQGDEFMAAIQRKLYNNLSELQDTLSIENSQSEIAFDLRMNYP